MNPSSEILLAVSHVSKQYASHQALSDVSISVARGQIYGLLGPNGAGKTSLIRIINQITAPDTGEVRLNGEKLQAKHIENIGYLPEERGLYKKMKVAEQVLYLARLKGLSRAEATRRIKYWFEKFEMQAWEHKKVEELSKGMQQKVQFITTVIHSPELIILDEPFSGFDPINANLIRDELLDLKNKGATIIFSTHRMDTVEELCDSIALIDRSKKILEGTKKEVKSKYRTHTFEVICQGDLSHFSYPFDRLGLTDEGYTKIDIKQTTDPKPNAILQELIEQGVVVYEFKEKMPSMNDVFMAAIRQTH